MGLVAEESYGQSGMGRPEQQRQRASRGQALRAAATGARSENTARSSVRSSADPRAGYNYFGRGPTTECEGRLPDALRCNSERPHQRR